MSARERLIQEFVEHGVPFHSRERSERWVDQLLAEHAHELAERQRDFVRLQAGDPFHYGSAAWAIRGVDEAADLIDPEVTE